MNALKASDPEFYAELTGTKFEETNIPSAPNDALQEDEEPDFDAALEDDSDLPSDVLQAVVSGRKPRVPIRLGSDGAVAANAAAESNDEPVQEVPEESGSREMPDANATTNPSSAFVEENGKRKRKENSRYSEAGLRWWKDV